MFVYFLNALTLEYAPFVCLCVHSIRLCLFDKLCFLIHFTEARAS